MATDFSNNLIKSYKYWDVYVNQNQGYLGRCIIWCKREEAEDMIDATEEEQKELFEIIKDLRKAVQKCFNADWFNYAFLGNQTRHLHGHFIPRYKEPKVFMGTTFIDECYGDNYITDPVFTTPPEVLEKVKSSLQVALG